MEIFNLSLKIFPFTEYFYGIFVLCSVQQASEAKSGGRAAPRHGTRGRGHLPLLGQGIDHRIWPNGEAVINPF